SPYQQPSRVGRGGPTSTGRWPLPALPPPLHPPTSVPTTRPTRASRCSPADTGHHRFSPATGGVLRGAPCRARRLPPTRAGGLRRGAALAWNMHEVCPKVVVEREGAVRPLLDAEKGDEDYGSTHPGSMARSDAGAGALCRAGGLAHRGGARQPPPTGRWSGGGDR